MLVVLPAMAQRADYRKMSPLVRHLHHQTVNPSASVRHKMPKSAGRQATVCAFVEVSCRADSLFSANGCRSLARFGNIHIAEIPLNRLGSLSLAREVGRIEANQSMHTLMDRVTDQVNARPVYAGEGLPKAYTGRGVVMGIMDVGFDLTHPNFFDITGPDYRIRALWDQLSADTLGSSLFVGADYEGEAALLGYAHSRDGLKLTHGTHTLGTAAGSGSGTPYRGIAPESDICLVSNAVTDDLEFIDSLDLYKYTYATDALGFKYIFDYAEAHNQPCVISFSEGSSQDFIGDDLLYHAVLDSLTGPGRIIVASAGNNGHYNTYFRKPRGKASDGTFLRSNRRYVYFTLKSADAFELRLKAYREAVDSATIALPSVVSPLDSMYTETFRLGRIDFKVEIAGYPSCYDEREMVYEVYVEGVDWFGYYVPFSIEVAGTEADVEFYHGVGDMVGNDLAPSLHAGEHTHSVNSPASAGAVICVGGTSYVDCFVNVRGDTVTSSWGEKGLRGEYSSVGPAYDGRMKPDVMAPGVNVVSSMSSYYMEAQPEGSDMEYLVEEQPFGGRTYGWCSFSGTSMASPVVGGAIALWLEANPRLTRDDVMEVIAETATHPDPSLSYPNNWYGHGQIDVYSGLLKVLGLSSVGAISTRQPRQLTVVPQAGRKILLQLQQPSAHDFSVSLYDLSGRLADKRTLSRGATAYTLDFSLLPAGVYAVQVDAQEPSISGSTLVRL